MTQTAPAPPPTIDVRAAMKEAASSSSSSSSLPASPSEILPVWNAPEIPKTIKASFAAWIKNGDGGAAAELFLYRRSGYFNGAVLHNTSNADLHTAFQEAASNTPRRPDQITHAETSTRATIGTKLHQDGKVGSIRQVDIGKPIASSWFSAPAPRLINMLEIGMPVATPDPSEEKLVLLHGYGAGTGFFFQNIAAMASRPHSRLYALDWLGMGRSSRVPFQISSHDAKETETRVEAAESFFVQALEEWRQKIGLEKMTLVAHSLGGYLSIAYSLKYPERVSRLVLVSPAGIPEGPQEEDSHGGFKAKPNGRGVEAEVTQPQEEHVPDSKEEATRDAQQMKEIPSRAADETQRPGNAPPRFGSKTRAVFTWLWERNASPFGLVRASTFLGPMLVGRYTSRRFGALPDEELRSLHAYCAAIFSARGSSEYCLAHLLAPGAYARMPMVHRISALPTTLPISFLYGEVDWMDLNGGIESVIAMNKAGNTLGSTFVVPDAGHHIYLDNPKAFDTLLRRILDGKLDGKSNAR